MDTSGDDGSSHVELVYGPLGDKSGVMQGQTALQGRVPLPGGAVAEYTGGSTPSYYWHSDWQGSVRLATTSTQGLYMDSAYAPYGEQYALAGSNWATFAGLQQNLTLGTYDADFRHYSPVQGRWLSPDPAGLAAVDITNPQSWNRYAYVKNNPTSFIDPSGLGDPEDCLINIEPEICGAGTAGFLPVFPIIVFGGGGGGHRGGGGGGMGGMGGMGGTGSSGGMASGGTGLGGTGSGPLSGEFGPIGPLSLGQLLGIPGVAGLGGCDFGVCSGVPDGFGLVSTATAVEVGVGVLGEAACIVAEPCGVGELVGALALAAAFAYANRQKVPTIPELQTKCTAVGGPIVRPSTSRPGWTSEEQEYDCQGVPFTIHCLVSPTRASQICHVRPGGPKGD